MRWSQLFTKIPFLLLMFMCKCSLSLVCPLPIVPGSSVARNKTCPDFKANPTFVHCCTSKLPPTNTLLKEKHGVYCCSSDDFEKEKQEAANAELRNFLREYLAMIIFGSVFLISIVVLSTALICKKVPGCLMYRSMHMIAHPSDSPAAMYRPVDQIPPKMYEAPPPYECFVAPPPTTMSRDNNEWNCILENEANQARRTPPHIS